MVDAIDGATDRAADGLVQLRFADEAGNIQDLNAAELAEVLQGLVEFTSRMARAGLFGDGVPPEVRIRPVQDGSVILEAIIQGGDWAQWVADNPEAAWGMAMSAGGAVAQALNVGYRRLRSPEAADIEYLGNGNVKVKWSDGTVRELPAGAWKELNGMKRATKKALRKIAAPLGDDADRLEIRDGRADDQTEEVLKTEPDLVVDRTDYRAAAAEVDEEEEEIRTFDAEAQLRSIDFRPGEKWRVQTSSGTRQATIDDEDFLQRLDEGMAIQKNDLFDVTIREVATTRNGRTTREWTLTRVVRKRRGGDDGDGRPAARGGAA